MPKPTLHSESCNIYKSNLSGRSHDFDRPTINWLIAWIEKHQDFLLKADVRNPYFRVSIWPEHGKPSDPGYAQVFHGRVVAKEDLKNAREYAKACLMEGAVLASISLWMFVPEKYDFANVYGELWEMK
jgi:hypothetical protein